MMKEDQINEVAATENGMDRVAQGWEERDGPAVFATLDMMQMIPNAIYVGEIRYVPGEGFIIADNYFSKTLANIKSGSKGSVLFLTKERKSFQVKGTLSYHTGGPIYAHMQSWHDPKYPGKGAVLLRIEEAYSGAEELFRAK
ncbi:MAG: pyridoxamine 5'-phosphate oxidase family protein [Acidobacteriaceae bacterium]